VISGRFGLNFVLPMPVVRATLQLPGLTQDFVAVDFLVDTGATSSCLHPRDAKIGLGIDPAMLADSSRWPSRRRSNGIGGMATSYVWPAVFQFEHDDGSMQQVTHEIDIAQPSASNATLPSLLGMNVLRRFRVMVDYVGQQVILR
jgi:predicted aspartyl protease